MTNKMPAPSIGTQTSEPAERQELDAAEDLAATTGQAIAACDGDARAAVIVADDLADREMADLSQ